MGKVTLNKWQVTRLVCLLLIALSLLGAAALQTQAAAQRRGLNLGSPLNRPLNLYGLNVQLLGDPNRDATLSTLKDQGFGWVRQKWDWQNTDWDESDAVTAATRANGLGLVAVLTGAGSPDPVAFAGYASEFAARYKDRVDVYQIWDEPNLEIGWSGPPSAADYAHVLQTAYAAIHEADPTATVLLAGLAPTIESGPKNISDVLYLRQLYELGTSNYFDGVAGKPYGYNSSPADRTADGGVLNFSRLILLREEMVAQGDNDKFVWGANFGWNTQPSIWGQVSPEQQSDYTRAAYARAANEWAWAGPLFLETPRPDDVPDDPHNGFAIDTASVISKEVALLPGTYAAQSLGDNARFEGAWEFSELGADIPQDGSGTISFEFEGSELAATVRRADYRAYLYVTIDGQAANALPKDESGAAYAILTSPDLQPHIETIVLASGLTPGKHTAIIRADRGWDQWALVSFTVGPNVSLPDTQTPQSILLVVAVVGVIGFFISFRSPPSAPRLPFFTRLSDFAQTLLAGLVALILWAAAWLTWGDNIANTLRRYGEAVPLIVTVVTAGLLYFSPFLILTLVCLALLFLLFYLRPALALPLIAFFIPFYLIPRPLYDRAFSIVEVLTWLATVATLVRWGQTTIIEIGARLKARQSPASLQLSLGQWIALDWAVLAFVIVCFASSYLADIRGVAIHEFRVVVLDSALFYMLLRTTLTPRPPLPMMKNASLGEGEPLQREGERFLWFTIDFFLLGALVVALYGLSNLITGENLITAEGGIARIRSIFGSPNNLGLYLGRAIPIAAAVALLGRHKVRRIAYAVALLIFLAAALLSFSRGALLLGIPASLVVVILFWGGRRAAIALGVLATGGALSLIPLSQNPRFANLFSTSTGTGFFRINVWRSAWAMVADHPLLGVGLDNFLYAYRGRYIQPEAWEEPNLPHAHNIFLDALSRTGLLGLAALLAILVAFANITLKCLRATTNNPDLRALTVGLLACMANTVAHGMVDTGFWFVDLAFVFMLVLGMMGVIQSIETQ